MNMKKTDFIMLVIIIAFYACNEKTHELSNSKHFESKTQTMAFDYPTEWTIDTLNGKIELRNEISDVQDQYVEVLSITKEQLPMLIVDSIFHKATMAEIKISNPNLTLVEKGIVTFDQKNYHTFDFDFTPEVNANEPSTYHVATYDCLQDSTGYVFHFTCEKKLWPQFEPKVNVILKSFKAL
jgi:hypothetical protein